MSLADDYAAVRKGGGVIDLASRVKLWFTGNDRVRYLNGQVTAKLTGANGVQHACVTTAKGKLCADVFIGTWPAGIVVDADAAVASTLFPRLGKYVVADDVEIEDVTASTALIHCVGVAVEQMNDEPSWTFAPVNRLGIPGIDLVPQLREGLAPIWEKLTERFPVVSEELAEVFRIESGIPRWGWELDENTLPAEAGLDRTHVDFHKGCYIGQEVISRIKSVGHVNRSLRGFVSPNGEPIPRGARIAAAEAPGESLGTITSATFSVGLNRPVAMGYLKRNAVEAGLCAFGGDGSMVPVSLHALPFL